MDRENPPGLQVEGWLGTLGIDSLSQWDVLVFLFRHPASLVSAEHIAQLLGYATAPVVDALERLESLGYVERSRPHQGVRLYQFRGLALPPRGDCLGHLMLLADNRALRLVLRKKLTRTARTDANNFLSRSPRSESKPWLKAV